MLVYLNAQGRLDEAIAAVESSGGKVLQPKHQIGPYGFRAVVLDSEGNRVACIRGEGAAPPLRSISREQPPPLMLRQINWQGAEPGGSSWAFPFVSVNGCVTVLPPASAVMR